MGACTDLQAFCNFRQLSHHIQKLRATVHLVMIFSHEKIVGAYIEVAGHDQVDRRLSITALHLAEMIQTDIGCFGHFLLGHSLCLAKSAQANCEFGCVKLHTAFLSACCGRAKDTITHSTFLTLLPKMGALKKGYRCCFTENQRSSNICILSP